MFKNIDIKIEYKTFQWFNSSYVICNCNLTLGAGQAA